MAENFKILTPRDHVRLRVGMYMGSSSVETVERFVSGVWKKVSYVPALSKMVDEILDNSIDEAIRTGFKHANFIDVSVSGDSVCVTDNGRGIPQDAVHDAVSGEDILRPVAAWTRVNAGTSFSEDRVTIGTNGVGSSATNFLSSSFTGRTWSKGKEVSVVCDDGGLSINVATKTKSGSGTSVSFVPDFSLFEIGSLQDLDTVDLIQDRLLSLQMAFPEITFSYNKKKILVNDLKKYAALYAPDGASAVIEKTDNLSFFFAASDDGFRTTSFVNGVNTRQGGAYVDFIVNGVIDELIPMVKRKYRVEVARSVIKNGLTFVSFARNFVDPRFDSQTKERLTNSTGNVKDHFTASGSHDFKYLAKKLFAASDIVEPILAAQIAKKMSDDRRDSDKEQRKLKKVKVAKHIAANNPKATLCLVEGDSAMGFLLKVRDPSKIGAYPLRGVIMNTWDMKPADVLKNKELGELVAILGLNINDPNSIDDATYLNIATLTDSDHDGSGHISPLIVAFFYKFWPRLLEEGRIKITRSPIMISTNGKDTKWFYTYEDANSFKQTCKGYNHRYIKGLGSLTEEEYSQIINNPKFDTVAVDDPSYFKLMFGADSSSRKEFMTK